MGKSNLFLCVIAGFSLVFVEKNRSEPARKIVQDDKDTYTNLYEGPGMIFQPLLSHYRLLQSFRHGKKDLIS